jgi:hypothetical protein
MKESSREGLFILDLLYRYFYWLSLDGVGQAHSW